MEIVSSEYKPFRITSIKMAKYFLVSNCLYDFEKYFCISVSF